MNALAEALSAALLHLLWQGTLVAFLLWIALWMLRNRSANARYLVSCAALALMAALPAITTWMLWRQPAAIVISSASSGTSVAVYVERIARHSGPLAWIAMWKQWTLPVWSLGVLVFALRLALSCRHVAGLRRMGNAAEGQVVEAVSLLARRMKVGRAIRVLISSAAESPSVVGWLRPAILLPAATLAGLEPEQLRAVLAHEIAHIRRHDYLVNLAQTLVETLLFYHPAVWWVSARIRHERELCCDDAAVAMCGDAVFYARALTSLERLRGAMPPLALGSAGGSLLYRIQRLAGAKQETGFSKLSGIAALALGLACFAATVHWAKAQQTMQQQQVPEEWGITVLSTGEVLHRDRVPYPEATYKNGIQGTVMLEATLDRSGNVADAHVLSGPPELRKTALQAVLQWQFANGRAGETQQVSIAFQQDARAQAQQRSQNEPARAPGGITDQQDAVMRVRQASLTESFLKDELRAAQERGDSATTKELEQKLNAAEEAKKLEEEKRSLGDEEIRIKAQDMEFLLEGQVSQMNRQLAEARKTYTERHPQVVALLRQIDELNEQITQFKLANQGRLPAGLDTDQTLAPYRSQYLALTQQLAHARQTLSEQHPQLLALLDQVEALRKKLETASLVSGARLARIEISGVPDSARDELAARITIKLGDILSQESMDSAITAIHQFDQRLECRFQRAANGDVVLRITGH
jgi:TonB family protein